MGDWTVTPGPDAFLVGAMKAGTTSMADALRTASCVTVPLQKELHHYSLGVTGTILTGPGDDGLNRAVVRDAGDYAAVWGKGPCEVDASTTYLAAPGCAARIRAAHPAARIVISLRDPSSRAFSAYGHLRRDDRETESFTRGLDLEATRRDAGWDPMWHYTGLGMYAEQVRSFVQVFGPDRVLIVLFEEFVRDPRTTLDAICRFISGQPYDGDEPQRKNRSGVPANRGLHRALLAESAWKKRVKRLLPDGLVRRVIDFRDGGLVPLEPMSDDDADRLRSVFADDVDALCELLERDLRRWWPGV